MVAFVLLGDTLEHSLERGNTHAATACTWEGASRVVSLYYFFPKVCHYHACEEEEREKSKKKEKVFPSLETTQQVVPVKFDVQC